MLIGAATLLIATKHQVRVLELILELTHSTLLSITSSDCHISSVKNILVLIIISTLE